MGCLSLLKAVMFEGMLQPSLVTPYLPWLRGSFN